MSELSEYRNDRLISDRLYFAKDYVCGRPAVVVVLDTGTGWTGDHSLPVSHDRKVGNVDYEITARSQDNEPGNLEGLNDWGEKGVFLRVIK